MGSALDRAPDLTRSPTGAHPPLPTRPRLRPIASTTKPPPGRQPKLPDRVRDALRSHHDSRRTEQGCCQWVKQYIFSHTIRHPADMPEPEISSFLTHLTLREKPAVRSPLDSL